MTVTSTLTTVPAALVHAGRNDRQTFDDAELAKLAASIDEQGCLQPPTVRPVDDGYEIVAGERRFRAMTTVLGWADVPVVIRPDLADDDRAASLAMLVENVQRSDLNALEEAEAYRARLDDYGYTVEELAILCGVAPFRIRWRLDLLNLGPEAAQLVRDGQLSPGFARQVSRLDVNRQLIALRALQRDPNLGSDDFGLLCDRLAREQGQEAFDLGDVLVVDEWIRPDRDQARRFTRRDLVTTLADLLELVDGALGDDALAETEAATVARARAALRGERRQAA